MREFLAMTGITKRFPGVTALDGVTLRCARGEVHALVGENGAGKTTLMNILSGLYRPDAGEVRLDGQPVSIGSPSVAGRLGIGFVRQESSLLPNLTVTENIFLGRELYQRGTKLLKRRGMTAAVARTAQSLGYHLKPQALVGDLSLAEQQLVEVTRALLSEPRLLIMDEPTAALTEDEVDRLFAVVAGLKARGVTIIFISHRLDEVLRLADHVTILKDGKLVGVLDRSEANRDRIIELMVGRNLTDIFPPRRDGAPGPVVLEARNLTIPGQLKGVDLTVRAGEIVGLGGLEGHGQRALARALFGEQRVTSGTIALAGRPLPTGAIPKAVAAGVGYLPHDRRGEGLVLSLSVRDNAALASLGRRARAGFIEIGREQREVEELATKLEIKCRDLAQEVQYLSGGNQQKVVLAKWLLGGLKVLLFDEPTKGIDVGAKVAIYHLIRDLARQGMAVIILTSDMMELLGLSDRIVVCYEGRITADLPAAEATEEQVMRAASGIEVVS